MEILELLKKNQPIDFLNLPRKTPALPEGRLEKIEKGLVVVSFPANTELKASALLHSRLTMAWEHDGHRQECSAEIVEVDGATLTLLTQSEARREYLRISALVCMIYEVVSPEAYEQARENLLTGSRPHSGLEIEANRFWHGEDLGTKLDNRFEQLTQLMKELSDKMDYLLALAENRTPARAPTNKVDLLTISASGVSFVSPVQVAESTILKMRIQLSRFPLQEVEALGRVARCTPASGSASGGEEHEIGVHFNVIHEDDREVVFRFVSRTERQLLRERKDLRDS